MPQGIWSMVRKFAYTQRIAGFVVTGRLLRRAKLMHGNDSGCGWVVLEKGAEH